MTVIDRMIKLQENKSLMKYELVVQGVLDAIDDGELKIGDQLPSINELKRQLKFSGVTISKGYNELKRRGLIKSIKVKGYFVISQETCKEMRIVLVLLSFQRSQEEFYCSLRKELGDKSHIDVFFHHGDKDSFETILSRIKDTAYEKYIIELIPGYCEMGTLESFEKGKLMVIGSSFTKDGKFQNISFDVNENTVMSLEYQEMGKKVALEMIKKRENLSDLGCKCI